MKNSTEYDRVGRHAESYDRVLEFFGFQKAANESMKQLPEHFSRDEVIRVLEAGSGTGVLSFATLEEFPNAEVSAFDLNPDMVKFIRSKADKVGYNGQMNAFVGDVLEPPISENALYDVLLFSGIFEHFNIQQIENIIRDLSKHLRPDGYAVHSCLRTNLQGRTMAKIFKARVHTRKAYVQAFENAGFTFLEDKTITYPFYHPVAQREFQFYQKESQENNLA